MSQERAAFASVTARQLSQAVSLLATSIFVLAAVLAGVERGRIRRAKDDRQGRSRDHKRGNEHKRSATGAEGSQPGVRRSEVTAAPEGTKVKGSTCGSGDGDGAPGGGGGAAGAADIVGGDHRESDSDVQNRSCSRTSIGEQHGQGGPRIATPQLLLPQPAGASRALFGPAAALFSRVPLQGGTGISPAVAPSNNRRHHAPDIIMLSSPTSVEMNPPTATVASTATAAATSNGSTKAPAAGAGVSEGAGAGATASVAGAANGRGGRRLEVLVHNISHKDMVLSLRRTLQPVRPNRGGEQAAGGDDNAIDAPDTALARPKFSLFKPSSELILNKLLEMRESGESEPPPAMCTVYHRGEPEYSLHPASRQKCSPMEKAEGSIGKTTSNASGNVQDSSSNSNSNNENGSITDNFNSVSNDMSSICDTGVATATKISMSTAPAGIKRRGKRKLAVGFNLDAIPIPISDLAGYRVRSEDEDLLSRPPQAENASLSGRVYMNRRNSSGQFMKPEEDVNSSKRQSCMSSRNQQEGAGRHGGIKEGLEWRGDGGQDEDTVENRTKQAEDKEEEDDEDDEAEPEAFISGVYFPLLSVLMPRWIDQLTGYDDGDSDKTVLLVSGVGQPRNQDHRVEDNSTEVTAMLMEAFVKRHYPDVRVVRVHSDTNIFRYDDNIRFVKTELLPLLNQERSRMAEKYGEDWQDMMHITMSFADGSPARISSINTALRHFRPSFIHIWELKTFWHEKMICEDDVEVHTFEDIDMLPPMPASEVDKPTTMIISEMLRLRGDLERILAAPARGGVVGGDTRDDLASFWLRKTKKPVLAVLLVQKKGGKPQLYRGTNMEVSMPTGSLCAERNVIGSALAADLSLLRRDIKAVAVLAVARLGTPPPALVGSAIANGSGNENHAGGSKGNASGTPWSGAISGGISGRGDGGSSGGGVYGGPRGGVAMVGDRGPGELFSPAGDSALGSSAVPSGAMSPLTLTPALDTLTPAWDTSRGGFRNTRERDREEVVGIGHVSNIGRGAIGALWPVGAEARMDRELEGMADQKTLEGVRQALFEVAAEERKATASTLALPAATSPATVSTFFLEDKEELHPHEHQKATDDSEEDRLAIVARRAKHRFRSESCTDELLAAGRVRTEEAFGSSGGVSNGANHSAGATAMDLSSGATVAAIEGAKDQRISRFVHRSQSFDMGTGEGSRRASFVEEELPRTKIQRGTKIVRSMTATPIRNGISTGSTRGTGSGRVDDKRKAKKGGKNASIVGDEGGAGSKSGLWDGRHEDEKRRHSNRSSIVAHVPAEALCTNPLKPCGACLEWLKKIAEVNPDFKVITFTDSRCGGVYIEDVAQIL